MTGSVGHAGLAVEDVASVGVRFAGGAVGTIHGALRPAGPRLPRPARRCAASTRSVELGSRGRARRAGPRRRRPPRRGRAGHSPAAGGGLRRAGPRRGVDLIGAIRDGRETEAPIEALVRALEVIDAAYESARDRPPRRLMPRGTRRDRMTQSRSRVHRRQRPARPGGRRRARGADATSSAGARRRMASGCSLVRHRTALARRGRARQPAAPRRGRRTIPRFVPIARAVARPDRGRRPGRPARLARRRRSGWRVSSRLVAACRPNPSSGPRRRRAGRSSCRSRAGGRRRRSVRRRRGWACRSS